jgi:hypothetical protein
LPVPVSPSTSTLASDGGDPRQEVVEPLHALARPDQRAEAAQLAQLAAQAADLLLQLPRAREVGEHLLHAREVDGLRQVVRGSAAQRLDRGLERGLAGDQDHLRRAVARKLLEQLHSGPVREVEVEQHGVRSGVRELGARVRERRCRRGGETLALHDLREALLEGGVVIDDQCMRHKRTLLQRKVGKKRSTR